MPKLSRPIIIKSPSLYVVHHLESLDSFLNAPEHDIEACDTGILYPTGSPTAEIAPLLPRSARPPHDHSIFLRVCHSPWHFLNQRDLTIVRGFLALYMSLAIVLNVFVEITCKKRGQFFVFRAENFWTLQHLKAPRRHHSVNPHDQGGLFLKLYNALSIPSAPNAKPKTGFLFSILYTAAVTIPLVITLVYWFVLRASNPDRAPSTLLHLISFAAGDSAQVSATTSIHIASLGVKAISTFSSINMSVLNSVIALFEILVLSSVRKQKPLVTHVGSILAIFILYIAWTGIGCLINGSYVYMYLDPNYAGWRLLIFNIIMMASLTTTIFFFQRSLHRLRERLTQKDESAR